MPRPSAPDAVRRPDEHFLIARDGTAVHYWYWAVPVGGPVKPRGVVLMVHGAGEYGERYRAFGEHLNSRGYHAAALDLRGFGQSGGPRAFVRRFSDYIEDIAAVGDQALRLSEMPSLHLLGHSMGGLAAASAAAEERPARIASLVLSSPCFALQFPVPAHLRAIGAVCSVLKPAQLFATKAISELLTHDPVIARQHREDPRIVHFMSARLFFEMHRQMSRFQDLARRISVPTAVFQAEDDRVVNRRASRAFFEILPNPAKRWTLYPGLFHEILNETSRANVYEDVVSYLDSI
jgi:alpha-beta hydrolase superfamily lysophospholipase